MYLREKMQGEDEVWNSYLQVKFNHPWLNKQETSISNLVNPTLILELIIKVVESNESMISHEPTCVI